MTGRNIFSTAASEPGRRVQTRGTARAAQTTEIAEGPRVETAILVAPASTRGTKDAFDDLDLTAAAWVKAWRGRGGKPRESEIWSENGTARTFPRHAGSETLEGPAP